jgi:hypothetical protein
MLYTFCISFLLVGYDLVYLYLSLAIQYLCTEVVRLGRSVLTSPSCLPPLIFVYIWSPSSICSPFLETTSFSVPCDLIAGVWDSISLREWESRFAISDKRCDSRFSFQGECFAIFSCCLFIASSFLLSSLLLVVMVHGHDDVILTGTLEAEVALMFVSNIPTWSTLPVSCTTF